MRIFENAEQRIKDDVVDIKPGVVIKYRSLSPDSYRDGEGDGACLPAGRGEPTTTQPSPFGNSDNIQYFHK